MKKIHVLIYIISLQGRETFSFFFRILDNNNVIYKFGIGKNKSLTFLVKRQDYRHCTLYISAEYSLNF